MGGISIWQLLIILAIIVVLFGTKKLRNIGSDLGGAVRGFKKAMGDEDKDAAATPPSLPTGQVEHKTGQVIDAKAEKTEEPRRN
ncbi:MAG: Sec-independent protein translocase subunit TatA [Gammaproteobacteria bacterium]|nr:Sec-independent protein translocase subunit TatA [Gammaproteobacteria bacterium]